MEATHETIFISSSEFPNVPTFSQQILFKTQTFKWAKTF